jgi:hypothetical protein
VLQHSPAATLVILGLVFLRQGGSLELLSQISVCTFEAETVDEKSQLDDRNARLQARQDGQ